MMTGTIRLVALVVAAGMVCAACAPAPREDPLSSGDHFVDLPGVRLHYRVEGEGPVLLLHPGGPGMEWKYARMPELEKFLKVVYLDPRGAGASSKPLTPGTYSLDGYVEDLDALRAHLGRERVFLLGHSHGGMVAQAYALAHADRLQGLILCATTPTTGEAWTKDVESSLQEKRSEPWFADAEAAFTEEEKAKTDAELAAIFRREVPLYFYRYEPFRETLEPILRDLHMAVEPLRQFGLEASTFDLRPRLAALRAPTLILAGRHDFVCGPRWAEALHQGIAGSRLVVLENSGHFLYLEEAAAFAEAVRGFIEPLSHGERR